MDAAEYKHVALGLIFLKYVSDAFTERRAALEASLSDPAGPDYLDDPADREDILESRDEYLAENVFWVPAEARWEGIQAGAKQSDIGRRIDIAMDAIERENPSLRGVLPKNYARQELDIRRLGELVDLIGSIGLGTAENREKDLLGRVYEYFLGQFAASEGKGGGEFYTPRSVVRLLVEMLEPFRGRVYDPCCGSGGMFVQAEDFVLAHGGRKDAISVYGQESNPTTWRIAKMNLALRGIEANLGPEWGDTFHDDKHPDLRADFILANPPFNISDWGGERLRDDPRWQYGVPPASNANYAWLQHIVSKLSPQGTAGVVLAVGSLMTETAGEGDIRKTHVTEDLVECMVALPPQLFYNTGISACLWFLNRDKSGAPTGRRSRRNEILFIDARQLGKLLTRVHRELSAEDIARISSVFHSWRGEPGSAAYKDVPGFAKSATLGEVASQHYVLAPGRYVGTGDIDADHERYAERGARLASELADLMDQSRRLDEAITATLTDKGWLR
ncbi:MAG: type I restriction-modification system subunit M [Chloroflexota bacterium]|nr:type I restriction-modification system subunit M [Chloroflexota bacterium]